MDIKRIKYSHELLKHNIRLEKELSMVIREIVIQQEACNHIKVCLGWNGPYQDRDTSFHTCLFCQKDDPDSQYRTIDATNYRKLKYSHGENEMIREKRLLDIQSLALDIMRENPKITETELVEKLNKIIAEEELKTKEIEKRLGYRHI